MAEKMMAYIRSQPNVWREVYEKREQRLGEFCRVVSDLAFSRIIAIGSGSSYNAACCVKKLFADELGIQVLPCVPTQADTLLNLCAPQDTLVLLISQSGESTSTIGVLERVKARGFQNIAITETPTSTIAKNSGGWVELACGEETVGPKTKGFTTTVLTLQLMALALCEKRGKTEACERIGTQLETSFQLAPERIERSVQWAAQQSQRLCAAPHLMVLAEGENRPAMLEAALKLLETLYIPAVSYEFEEYLHGVHCTIGPGSHLILVIPNTGNRERMLRLAAFNEAHGGVSHVISIGSQTGVQGELNLGSFHGPYTPCYDVLLPFQVVSALVSQDKGIHCDKPKFPHFNRELGTKNG